MLIVMKHHDTGDVYVEEALIGNDINTIVQYIIDDTNDSGLSTGYTEEELRSQVSNWVEEVNNGYVTNSRDSHIRIDMYTNPYMLNTYSHGFVIYYNPRV